MKGYSFNYFYSVIFIILFLFSTSCEKDPVFEPGEYIVHYGSLLECENLNGIIFRWNLSMNITDEQKAVVRKIIMNMVKVEGGTFWMGAQSSNMDEIQYDPAAENNEGSVHEVTLSDYHIGKYEITQREWRVIMDKEQDWSNNFGYGDDIPAYNISWEAARQFVEVLSSMTYLNFTLPTEAQWEFAARGGTKSGHFLCSGDNDADVVAWHTNNSGGVLHNVGEKKANELGLFDMSGSLWEWCQDSYRSRYGSSQVYDPLIENGSNKVLRGGSWTYLPTFCRSTARISYPYNSQSVATGFRVVIHKSYNQY